MERSCGDRTVMMNGKKVRYIDPLSDWGFKRLFGTEVNKDFLRAFLQNLFPDKEISDITYMKPENQGLTRSDRQAVFDVACRTVGGERFIVEMQKRNQERFRERCLYYATFPIQEQAVKGDWNYSMSPVYMVSIMDFELIHDVRNIEGNEISGTDKRIFRYSLREDNTGELMTDRLKFVFIEIGNFSKEAEELVTGTDKWDGQMDVCAEKPGEAYGQAGRAAGTDIHKAVRGDGNSSVFSRRKEAIRTRYDDRK